MLEATSVLQAQMRRACADLERRVRAGERCVSEDLLAAYPALAAHTDSALELIYTEFVLHQERGEEPSPSAFIARFPRWRNDLQALFQVSEAVGVSGSAATLSGLPTVLAPVGSGSADAASPGRRLGSYELL